MAEYAYLAVAGRVGSAKPLLSAKRNIPIMWMLAFAPDDLRSDGGNLRAVRVDALARLERRAGRLGKIAGPKLRAVLNGLVGLVASRKERWLVLDASELGNHGDLRAELSSLLAVVARVDTDSDAALARHLDDLDLELDKTSQGGRVICDLDGDGTDASYPLFGGSLEGDEAWLRPPSEEDADRIAIIERAFADYERVSGPTFGEDDIQLTFRHRRHPGRLFVVTDAFDLSAHQGAAPPPPLSFTGISFPRTRTEAQLTAWAGHVARHLELLAVPNVRHDTSWWARAGAEAFAAAMPSLAEDAAALRAGMEARLVSAIVGFLPGSGPVALSLGPLGHVLLENVRDVEWEPHVRATLGAGAGDTTWWRALPDYFVSPREQLVIAHAYFAELAARANAAEGATLRASERGAALVLLRDRFEPERFTEGFSPARRLEREEIEGSYAFVGANLLIVVASGTRTRFKLAVPPDFDRSIPPRVSGFWTARSGDRFASVLRVGTREWRFDNDGNLL